MRSLAKLSAPKLAGAYARQRLFNLLDLHRASPVGWICGPPGAGKTSLVASYIRARKLQHIWYQIDAADTDPATFFHYLREAAPRRKPLLPLLTPEYLPDLSGFTRRFFRELFRRLRRSAVIVLDNFQDAERLAGIARDAAAELPVGINLIVISRAPPPPEFARMQINESLAVVNWEALRLTLEETAAIASLRGGGCDATAHRLHKRSGGWAAGLIVLIEHNGESTNASSMPDDTAPQALFDYFATEIFDRAPTGLRDLWLRTAYLPRFTAAMAQRLTGSNRAETLLDELSRRRYFTDRHMASEAYYEYHALFREFLRQQTECALTLIEQQQLAHRSAHVLEEHGEQEAAFSLYQKAGDWQSAIRLILVQAPILVPQGRWQTLELWITLVPRHVVEDTPWLSYWYAVSRTFTDPREARAILERAYQDFLREGDELGQGLAASAMIEISFFEWAEFASLDRWIAVLQNFLAATPALPSKELELRVITSAGLALLHRQPENPFLEECVRRIRSLLSSDLGPNEKIAAAVFLFHKHGLHDGTEEVQSAAAATQSLINDWRVTPINRFWWWNWLAHSKLRSGEPDEMLAILDRADTIARDNGLGFVQPLLTMCRTSALTYFGQLESAEALLKNVEPVLNHLRPNDVSFFLHLRSLHALLHNDLDAALSYARRASENLLESGASLWRALGLEVMAVVLARRGEHDAAFTRLREAENLHPENNSMLRQGSLLIEAYLAHLRGDLPACRENLRQGMTIAAERDYRNNQHWIPGTMPTLCKLALQQGVQVEYVRGIIKRLALKPDSPDIEHWPWPVRLYTLGHFSLVVDDAAVEFARKTPKKPIALLKLVIAAGGRQVSLSRVIDALWPDEEGDAAQKSFQITLHRLRKLLQHPEAVQYQEGRLSLNVGLCWVDAWGFRAPGYKRRRGSG